MALRYNIGTNKEIVVSRCSRGGCLQADHSYTNYYYYAWPNENLIPFNIGPFIQEFVGDSTKNVVPLLQLGTGSTPGHVNLYLSQQNDIISVRIGTGPDYSPLYSTPITGAANYVPIYFVYAENLNSVGMQNLMVLYGDELTRVDATPLEYQPGTTALVGLINGNIPISELPVSTLTTDGTVTLIDFVTTPQYYDAAPHKGFRLDYNASTGYHIQGLTGDPDLSTYVRNLDGTTPSPYDPPVPTPDDPFTPSDPDPYPEEPPTPDTSDLIDIPGNPTIGVTSAGFINVYNPALNALQGLGDIIFPNVASATDIVDAVIKLCETIANSNLINYVIDCHIIPVTPQTGANANIKVGFRDTGISVPKVSNDYVDATCGSLTIPEFFHGFQDYACTRSKIYLPFIGFVDTKPEYWQAGTISIDYKFNVIDGSFMCYIRSVSSKSALNGSIIAQYAGNACMHLPLTGVNYANMVSGLIGSAIAAASTGGTSAVLGSALSAANTIAQGGDVQQSNGYNSTAALMGVRTPYLLIERPVAAYPAGYAHTKGYPSNIGTQLSNITGFTIIEDIDLSGIPLTQGEIEELRGLLKEGVYF